MKIIKNRDLKIICLTPISRAVQLYLKHYYQCLSKLFSEISIMEFKQYLIF